MGLPPGGEYLFTGRYIVFGELKYPKLPKVGLSFPHMLLFTAHGTQHLLVRQWEPRAVPREPLTEKVR